MENTVRKFISASVKANGEKRSWSRIGIAFENKDGSVNLKFNYFPRAADTALLVSDGTDPEAESGPAAVAEQWQILGVVQVAGRDKGFWQRIGTASRTKNGWRLFLHFEPADPKATIQLRPPRGAD